MRLQGALMVLFINIFWCQPAMAEREPNVPLGRAGAYIAGMGGTGVSLSGNVETLDINPATLIQLHGPTLTAGYGNQASGEQRQAYIVVAMPLVSQLMAGFESVHYQQLSSQTSEFTTYLFSLAFPISNNGKLSLGMNLKLLQIRMPQWSERMSGSGMDLGLYYHAIEFSSGAKLLLGTSWCDAQTRIKNQLQELLVPNMYRLGATLQLPSERILAIEYDNQTSSVPDFSNYQSMRFGFEQSFALQPGEALNGRLGYIKRFDKDGVMSLGMGAVYKNWHLDYSIQWPIFFYDAFHQLGLSWEYPNAATENSNKANEGISTTEPTKEKTLEQIAKKQEINIVSALESAANLETEQPMFKKSAASTKSSVVDKAAEETVPDKNQENQTYHLSVPEGPAASESSSLGTAPEMPAYFSGYFANGPDQSGSFKITKQDLRLLVVVNPFSPIGNGRQNKTMFIGRLISDKLKVFRWILTISQGSNIVQFFKGGSTLPRNLEWDGRDGKGKVLSDGNYMVTLHAMNENGIELAAASQTVTIRTKAQSISGTGPGTRTLVGTEKIKPFVFEFQEAKASSEWKFAITNPAGRSVYQRSGASEVPRKLTWIPQLPDDRIGEGSYKARLTYLDEVGIKSEMEVKFQISFAKFELQMQVNTELFKPEKGVEFSITVPDDTKIQEWEIKIMDNEKEDSLIRIIMGKGSIPTTVHWDGKNAAGNVVQGGQIVQAVLRAVSSLGSEAIVRSGKLQCDLGEYTGQKALSMNLVRVLFGKNSSELKPEMQTGLNNAMKTLEQYNTHYLLQIVGHCDTAEEKGLELSRLRAQVVADYLIKQLNIPEKNLQIIGKGTTQLISQDNDETSRKKNSRVEIILFAQ